MAALDKALTFFGWIFVGCTTLFFLGLILIIATVIGASMSGEDLADLSIKTDHAVAVVELTGEIVSSAKFTERIRKVLDDEKIKAIVVRIDSPGGSVGASEEIYRQIKAADAKKPVTCALSNIAASGGLYSAVGCRKIVTNAGTLTGSIGVLLMMPNVSQIATKFGFQMNVVKSGHFKDSGSPFREFQPDERDLMQQLVNQTYEQFVKTVADSRKLSVADVKKFADGRVILGEQAVQLGLVDEIGGVERAAKIALEATGDTAEPEVIYPKKPTGLLGVFEDVSEMSWIDQLKALGQVQLLYKLV